MATIVLVHGIGQRLKGSGTLLEEWRQPLADGVEIAGFGEIADQIRAARSEGDPLSMRVAFYGNLFRPKGRQIMGPGEEDESGEPFSEQLAREWLERATRSTRESDRRTADIELAVLEGGPGQMGLRAGVRSTVNALAGLKAFATPGFRAAELVNSALGEVRRYLHEDELRETVLKGVLQLIGPETRVVIGHSLGSVVAFEAAHRSPVNLRALVTIGSPLGLRTIIADLVRPQPPGYPPRVGRWVNVGDPDDFVAAEPDLRALFAHDCPAGAELVGYAIENDSKPHSAASYLTTPEVGEAVAKALM